MFVSSTMVFVLVALWMLFGICFSSTIIVNDDSTDPVCANDEDRVIYCWLGGYCGGDDIICPADPWSCIVSCQWDNSCIGANINPYKTGYLAPLCQGANSCQGATINCGSNENCVVSCYGVSSCQNSTIICPSNADCNIYCIGSDSCDYANITWSPSSYTNNLTCNPSSNCDGVTLPPTQFGISFISV